MIGAAMLDAATYEEIEQDPDATTQAMIVVMAAGLAAGVGSANGFTLSGVVTLSLIAMLSWGAWALVTFEVGRRLLPEPQMNVAFVRVLRTFGFAASPGLLRVAGLFPVLATPAAVVAALWMLVAMVVALRQALEYRSTARALAVCLVGWVLSIAVAFGLQLLLNTRVS